MIITYSKLLDGYIVEYHSKYGRSMLAVDQNRQEAIKKALERFIIRK